MIEYLIGVGAPPKEMQHKRMRVGYAVGVWKNRPKPTTQTRSNRGGLGGPTGFSLPDPRNCTKKTKRELNPKTLNRLRQLAKCCLFIAPNLFSSLLFPI